MDVTVNGKTYRIDLNYDNIRSYNEFAYDDDLFLVVTLLCRWHSSS